jgi:hypothetical protein
MFCRVIPFCRVLLAMLCVCLAARAGEALPVISTNIALRPLGNGVFQLGSLRLNQRERAISFDAVAHIVSELAVEYALVHKIGKTHETVFRTDTRAQEIQVAMLLLGVKPAMTNAFPEDLSIKPPGDEVTIEVSWKLNGKQEKHPMEDLILNRETGKTLSRGIWVYNGSNFSEGMFTAQRDGSLISIHIDPDALINNPRPGRDNDDLHVPNSKLLPPTGTPVEFTIRLVRPEKIP